MPGQNGVGEIVEANMTIPADVALTKLLRVVMTIARDMSTAALGAKHPSRPAHLSNEFETFGFVEQARKIDEGAHDSNLRRFGWTPIDSHLRVPNARLPESFRRRQNRPTDKRRPSPRVPI